MFTLEIFPKQLCCSLSLHIFIYEGLLQEKTTNNFVLYVTPQQSKPLNNKKLHSNKCFVCTVINSNSSPQLMEFCTLNWMNDIITITIYSTFIHLWFSQEKCLHHTERNM